MPNSSKRFTYITSFDFLNDPDDELLYYARFVEEKWRTDRWSNCPRSHKQDATVLECERPCGSDLQSQLSLYYHNIDVL